MRRAWLALPLLLLAVSTSRANGGPEQAAAGAAAPAAVRLKQQLRAHGAEVSRLQREVRQQELNSRQASQRLEDREREVARLQRQLEALRGRPQAGDGSQ
jgi:chromosome segregation ATPase